MGPDILFAMPSTLSGVARSLDLGATFDGYNDSPSDAIADARALRADWAAVGFAIREAINKFIADASPDVLAALEQQK